LLDSSEIEEFLMNSSHLRISLCSILRKSKNFRRILLIFESRFAQFFGNRRISDEFFSSSNLALLDSQKSKDIACSIPIMGYARTGMFMF